MIEEIRAAVQKELEKHLPPKPDAEKDIAIRGAGSDYIVVPRPEGWDLHARAGDFRGRRVEHVSETPEGVWVYAYLG